MVKSTWKVCRYQIILQPPENAREAAINIRQRRPRMQSRLRISRIQHQNLRRHHRRTRTGKTHRDGRQQNDAHAPSGRHESPYTLTKSA